MTEKDFQERLSKATPSKPFQFFRQVGYVYDGSKIIWKGCLPENVDRNTFDLDPNDPKSFRDFMINFSKGYENRVLEDVDPFSLRKINSNLKLYDQCVRFFV